MCLTVKKLTNIDRLECFKVIWPKENGTYTTYFRDTPIPPNGILIPTSPASEVPESGIVRGGFIHGLTKTPRDYEPHLVFNAVAYNVVAYGVTNDFICRAMWIPQISNLCEQEVKDVLNRQGITCNIK